jgi:hypothetical protein
MFCGNFGSFCFLLINMTVGPLSSLNRINISFFATIYSYLIIQTDDFSVHLEVSLSHKYNTPSPAVKGMDYAPNIH